MVPAVTAEWGYRSLIHNEDRLHWRWLCGGELHEARASCDDRRRSSVFSHEHWQHRIESSSHHVGLNQTQPCQWHAMRI